MIATPGPVTTALLRLCPLRRAQAYRSITNTATEREELMEGWIASIASQSEMKLIQADPGTGGMIQAAIMAEAMGKLQRDVLLGLAIPLAFIGGISLGLVMLHNNGFALF